MAIPPRSTTTPISTVSSTVRGFVPPVVTSDNLVTVMLLGRKASTRDSILQTDANGKKRGQVLLNLVGVVLPLLDEQGREELNDQGETIMTCYPDPDGITKLPPVDSVGFRAIMEMPTGIFVRSIFAAGAVIVGNLAEKGYLGGLTREKVNDALADGTLGTLLSTYGGFLNSIPGIYERHELKVADVMYGEKTFSITLLGDEAEAFSESYNALQEKPNIRFQNVALTAQISGEVTATELSAGISYQPNETHFFWTKEMMNGRAQYVLDAKYAKSGRNYSTNVVSAANMSELAQRGTNMNHERNVAAINRGSLTRTARNNESMLRALNAGQATPVDNMNLV